MRSTLALLSVLGAVAAQGVTDPISPDGAAPAGCMKDFDGEMEVTVATVAGAKKRDLSLPQKRGTCGADGILVMTLKDGVLKDAKDRTGYIASNYQFQFDGPPQAGAIYTAGYSLCGNSTLALGGSTTFFQCKSGDFWNLYDRSWAAQCEPVSLLAMPCGAGGDEGGAGQIGDGQVVATQMYTTTLIKPISDGQPQVITTVVPVPMCQIGDGQVQGHTTPCASVTPAPAPETTPSAAPVSQYSDGQIQVTPPAPGTPSPSAVTPAPPPPPATTPVGTAPPVSSKPPATLSSVQSSASGTPTPSPSPAPVSRASHTLQMGSLVALFIGVVTAAVFL